MKTLKHILVGIVCLLPLIMGFVCFLTGYCYWFGCTDLIECSIGQHIISVVYTPVWVVGGVLLFRYYGEKQWWW